VAFPQLPERGAGKEVHLQAWHKRKVE